MTHAKFVTLCLGLLIYSTPVLAGDQTVNAMPYGVCGHVLHANSETRARHFDAMQLAGIKYVRSGIYGDSKRELRYADTLIDDLERRGMKLLMILLGNEHCTTPPKDLVGWSNSVDRIVRRYGDRVPVFEVWNEANLNGFFRGANPVTYAKVLDVAYKAGKAANPKCRFTFTGTSGIPFKRIEDVYKAGGTNFDAMAVHPYSHPYRPEGVVDVQTERLRELMAKYEVGDRPIWYTEVGWPTHSESIEHSSVFLAGLKVARPEQKSWNVIVATDQSRGEVADQDVAKRILELLPAGSRVRCCSQEETVARLKKDDADAVAYPFDSAIFPADTIEAVNGFIARGGVFVDFGGLPCYFGRRDNKEVDGMQHGGAARRFPFGFRAWWTRKDGRCDPKNARDYPKEGQVFATETGLKNGVKQEPTGFKCKSFLAPDRIGAESEWIPLVAGKATNGTELVAAAVIRYHGERKGAAVLSTLPPAHVSYGNLSEETQARYTARCAAIAMAEGIEGHFPYALWTHGTDPFYSEHHFSLLQENYAPKPAFSAYMTFIMQRPAESVQTPGEWHDQVRQCYYPQWTRPDGKKAGMVWRAEGESRRVIKFKGGKPVFRNLYGRRIPVLELEDNVYNVPISESPVYFEGAEGIFAEQGGVK